MADPDIYDFIKGQEGFNPRAYWDNKQWSIGYGTKAAHPGETIDQAEADRRLRSEVGKAGSYLDQNFPNLEPQRRDALTSFTYNLGPGWMTGPTRLGAAVRAGDWNNAASVMQEYNKASGEVNPGLVARRAKESALLLGAPMSASPPSSPPPSPGRSPMADYSYDTAGMSPEEVEDKRRYANQLRQGVSQHIPNSGLLGALAQMYSGYRGREENESASAGEAAGRGALLRSLTDPSVPAEQRIARSAGLPYGSSLLPAYAGMVQKQAEQESPMGQLDRKIKEAQLKSAEKKAEPTWGTIGQNEFGQPTYGWIDPTNRTATPAVISPAAPATPLGGGASGVPGITVSPSGGATPATGEPKAPVSSLTGDELLDRLKTDVSPSVANIVKGIAEGRQQPLPQGRGNARNQQIMAWVAQYDPTFDLTQWKARNTTHTAFAGGVEARNSTAINTAMKHAMTLYDAADNLDNWDFYGGKAVRTLTNPIAGALFGDSEAKLKSFEMAKTAVAEELGKAFHGAPTVTGTENWYKNISDTSSPQALRNAVATAVKLLEGRSEELTNQYTRAMGKAPDKPLIEPTTQAGFDLLKKAAAQNMPLAEALKKSRAGDLKGPDATAQSVPPPASFIEAAKAAGIPPEVSATVKENGRIRDQATGKVYHRINNQLVEEPAAPADAPVVPNPLSNFNPQGKFMGPR